MQDVLQTLGITNWLLIVVTKIWDIGWMLLKTSTGGNLIRTTSSTSAGFECKLNFVDIFCNLFTFHFFFTPVPNGARHFLAYRLDSTRLDSSQRFAACAQNGPTTRRPGVNIDIQFDIDSLGDQFVYDVLHVNLRAPSW